MKKLRPVSAYANIPDPLFTCLYDSVATPDAQALYCAGFELQAWRCEALADHIMEWLADYALNEDELRVSHVNMYVRLREAAARIYTSDKYKKRGELGEIALHAICRSFFLTIPVAPRVFYLTSSNDVVKSFDMVHVRYAENSKFELWLGEAKLFTNASAAIGSAIDSVKSHMDAGFLKNEKLLLGPQISKNIPHYDEIRALFAQTTSIDKLFESAVFPILIAADSKSAIEAQSHSVAYCTAVHAELQALETKLKASALRSKIRVLLIYLPLGSKDALADAFDKRLKGLQP